MVKTLVARSCSAGRQPGNLTTSLDLISTAGGITSPGWQDLTAPPGVGRPHPGRADDTDRSTYLY